MNRGAPSVLVLSHLYPSTRQPHLGLFVARQVQALEGTYEIRVVAPTRWVPPLTRSWRKERRLPRAEKVTGTTVLRPRVPQLPRGGLTAESLVLPTALRGLARGLHRQRTIELVHAHFGLPDGWGAAKLSAELHAPFVLSLWGSDVLVFPEKTAPRRLLMNVLRSADAVIAPSHEIADRARELGADAQRTSVIMGGVPDDYPRLSRASARAALGLSHEARLIVWVGNLVPVKQPLLAVQAISLVAERTPDVLLALVGDGPMRHEVARTVHEQRLERVVRMLGAVDAAVVAQWQVAADVVLNTSRSEGLPFAVSEALVSGTRVAAVPVGGVPEVLSATSGGTLAEDSTPEAVADAITHELGLPRDEDLPGRSAFLLLSNVAPRIGEIYSGLL